MNNKNLRVLVLNADFMPLNLIPLSEISWQDAMTVLVKGTATAVKFYENEYIRTPNNTFPVPSIIVLKSYKHFNKHAKWSKYNVKLRDDFKCGYCNTRYSARSLTIDHILPKSKGGKHSWFNSVTACKKCNQAKKDNHKVVPKIKPIRPTYYQLAKKMMEHKSVENEDWKQYIQYVSN